MDIAEWRKSRLSDHCIAWWNLENLFDVENSTQRPDWLQEFLKGELKGWTQQVLDKKISQLSKIISKMNNNKGPDILGVCEVENKPVMDLLIDGLSSLGRNYKVAHHDSLDRRGIDIAFVYDGDKFVLEKTFFHVVLKRYATRELFQANFRSSTGIDLILVGNHWPSRRGGTLETEPYRIIAAETLSYWHQRILEIKGKDVATIVMGDFNDDPHNRSMRQYALSTRCKKKVIEATIAPRLFNLMWPLMDNCAGTFYYGNFPYFYDQFLISKGLVQDNSTYKIKHDPIKKQPLVKIEKVPEMETGEYKIPRPFGRPSKNSLDEDGFSDHFPISLMLEES